jgi:hypothetical protein
MSEEQTGVEAPTAQSAGLVRGIPGRRIRTAGVLDLRGVPAEEVAKIEHIEMAGVILADEGNRAALGGVTMQLAGSVVVAPPDLRVLVQPDLEVSKAMVEGMAPGQKLMVVGNVFFRPEVPAALAAEKFEDLRIVGILVISETLLGALFGKLETTGVTVSVRDDVTQVVRSVGKTVLNADYLSRLADGGAYVNIGETIIGGDVPQQLLDQKIAAYHNVGVTTGPEPLLNLLKARCATNLGEFRAERAEEGPTGPEVSNFGRRTLTTAFLERLQDNSRYANFGKTMVAEEVSEELLSRKIAKYTNFGRTVGPGRLLAVLEDRCVENFGSFDETDEEEDDEECEEHEEEDEG